MRPDDFDVQRQSPYTPEGQIEAAGRFARGLGADRMRHAIAIAAVGAAALAVAVIAVDLL